jgi:uncharacterized protein YbaP (TraB family)
MKNILTSLLLLIVLNLGVASQATAELEDQTGILHPKGLLWKIDHPDFEPSYLFGTMHIGDSRVTRLPPPVEEAFTKADRFAMEMLLNFRALGVITARSFFDDGRTLKSIMRPDDYGRLIELLKTNLMLPEEMVINMRPWAVLLAMSMSNDSRMHSEDALDMVLYRRAALRKMPLLGLETPEEQLAVFESLPLQDQVWLLNRSVIEYGQYGEQMDSMLDAYLRRDLQALVHIQQQAMYADSDIDDRFLHELLDKRNQRMVVRMQDYLAKGKAFIAVGALHLPGEQGVLHLLEQRGYKVTPVY